MNITRRPWRAARRVSAIGLVFAAVAGAVLVGGASSATASTTPGAPACGPSNIWANAGTTVEPPKLIEFTPDGTIVRTVPLGRFFGDIAWSVDGTRIFAVEFASASNGATVGRLSTIDPNTGAELGQLDITGALDTLPFVPGGQIALNALSTLPDGRLLLGAGTSSKIFAVDPVTGVSTLFATYPSQPGGPYVSSGDFLTLPDGDILALATTPEFAATTAFRIHPDGTITRVGTLPISYGGAQTGGNVYLTGGDGHLYELSTIPTAASDAPIPVTDVVSTGLALNGATAKQDAGCVVSDSTAYSVAKSVSPAGPVAPGALVTYTVTVTNTGTNAYTGTSAGFSDDLAQVLDDAAYVDGSAVASSGTVSISGSSLMWSGPLGLPPAADSTATITYQVRVNSPDAGDQSLVNTVVPTAAGGVCASDGACTTTTAVTRPSAPSTSPVIGPSVHTGGSVSTPFDATWVLAVLIGTAAVASRSVLRKGI